MGEVAQHDRAAWRMGDFGMKLHSIEPARLMGDGGVGRAVRDGDGLEPDRQGGHLVAMAHPHGFAMVDAAKALEQGRVAHNLNLRPTKFARGSRLHHAAQRGAHGLLSIADPQHWHVQIEHRDVHGGAEGLMHAGRAARQDHGGGAEAGQEVGIDLVERMDLAIDARFTHPACNELCDLAAEIDDQEALVLRFDGAHGGPHFSLWVGG